MDRLGLVNRLWIGWARGAMDRLCVDGFQKKATAHRRQRFDEGWSSCSEGCRLVLCPLEIMFDIPAFAVAWRGRHPRASHRQILPMLLAFHPNVLQPPSNRFWQQSRATSRRVSSPSLPRLPGEWGCYFSSGALKRSSKLCHRGGRPWRAAAGRGNVRHGCSYV